MRPLWRTGLRFFLRDPWQLALAVLGVAVGVAVVVGIDLASSSASRAFDRTIEAVGGRATHRIVGGTRGVPESFYRELRVEHGVRRCAPVLEATGRTVTGGERGATLQILGIDPFAEAPLRPWLAFEAGERRFDLDRFLTEPGGVVLVGETAAELGLGEGATFVVEISGRRAELHLTGELSPAEPVARSGLARVAIADVATVQELTQRRGFLDRVDLRLSTAAEEAEIRALLPDGLVLEREPRRAGVLNDLTRAFRLNLQALGLLALLVGAFLIHNTMQFSVVRRRTWIGVLRALGATRGQVFTAVIGEAFSVGALGSLLGVVLGIALAGALVELVAATIRDFYFAVAVSRIEVAMPSVLVAIALGIGMSVLAALAPAREATAVQPRAALQRAELEAHAARGVLRAVPIGILLAVIGIVAIGFTGRSVSGAYAAIFLVLLGGASLVPFATVGMLRVLGGPLGLVAGSVGRWAARGAEAALSRTAVAAAALTLAVATTVGLGVMIRSFRETVAVWLDTTLRADVYASVPGPMSSRTEHGMDPRAVERFRALPQVGAVSTYRRVTVTTRTGELELAAVEPAPETIATLSIVSGEEANAAAALATGEALLVSEPLAFRLAISPGDALELRTDRGWRSFPVAAVFRDYASERGHALIARTGYDAWFDDPTVASVALWAAPGATAAEVLAAAEKATADLDQQISVRSNRALREGSLEVFDRTFAVTAVLRILCLIVAFLGVSGALAALQLERGRETGVLRAVGATPRQIQALLTLQNALLGLAAGVLALPLGFVLAWLLIDVVNRRSFGWTLLSFELTPDVAAQALGAAVLAAILAGLLPSWRLSRVAPAEVLRSE